MLQLPDQSVPANRTYCTVLLQRQYSNATIQELFCCITNSNMLHNVPAPGFPELDQQTQTRLCVAHPYNLNVLGSKNTFTSNIMCSLLSTFLLNFNCSNTCKIGSIFLFCSTVPCNTSYTFKSSAPAANCASLVNLAAFICSHSWSVCPSS